MKRKTKRLIISCCGAAAIIGLVLVLLLNNSSEPRTKYNIILIVSDALRQDVPGCYCGDAKTPSIDFLAENGVLFENAYSTAPCTLPSSVSMFTGNYSSSYAAVLGKVGKNRRGVFYVNEKERLLGEVLKDNGYDVVMEIENDLAARSNNLQGFRKLGAKKSLTDNEIALTEEITGIRDIDAEIPRSISHKYDRLYSLLHYLVTLPEDKNFFLVKWFSDPHAPYNPPEKFKSRIPMDTNRLPREETFYSQNKTISFRDIYKKGAFSTDELNYLKALYIAEVESVDQRVGFILKALTHRHLLKKTIIVFTSDHGESFGEHGWIGHGRRFSECQVRVPLIFSGPGIKKGKRVKQVTSHLGLMPTLKKLTGVEFTDNMKGTDYRLLLEGGAKTDGIVYFDWITNYVKGHNSKDALLLNDHKLMVDRLKKQAFFKLYNLRDDPDELRNISKANMKITRFMYEEIEKLRKENKKRLKKNLAGIDKKVDLLKRYSETLKKLKSLGYISDK